MGSLLQKLPINLDGNQIQVDMIPLLAAISSHICLIEKVFDTKVTQFHHE